MRKCIKEIKRRGKTKRKKRKRKATRNEWKERKGKGKNKEVRVKDDQPRKYSQGGDKLSYQKEKKFTALFIQEIFNNKGDLNNDICKKGKQQNKS